MDRVERELGLSRDDLIGLGILNGCDYNPDVSTFPYINDDTKDFLVFERVLQNFYRIFPCVRQSFTNISL